jgi:hypothetical protein
MDKVRVRVKYKGLSRQELLDEVQNKGYNYAINYNACAPSTVAALYDVLDFDAALVRAVTPLSGGTAEQFLGTCGILTGGLTVLGYYFGRPIEKMSDREYIQANIDALKTPYEIGGLLADRFIKEYGTFICAQIHRQIFGRTFCLSDPGEAEKYMKVGGLAKSAEIVGKGTRWVMEILLDKGALEL